MRLWLTFSEAKVLTLVLATYGARLNKTEGFVKPRTPNLIFRLSTSTPNFCFIKSQKGA